MINETQQRKGLIQSNHSVFSPILIREGLRPSIVAQHLEQVIKEKDRERRLQELIRLQTLREEERKKKHHLILSEDDQLSERSRRPSRKASHLRLSAMQKSEIEPSRKLLEKIEPPLAPVRQAPSRDATAKRGLFVTSMNVGDHDTINATSNRHPAMTMYSGNS